MASARPLDKRVPLLGEATKLQDELRRIKQVLVPGAFFPQRHRDFAGLNEDELSKRIVTMRQELERIKAVLLRKEP